MSDRSHNPGRRALLKRAAGVAGLTFAASAAGAETYGNLAKTMVGYQLVPHGNEACGNCALFVPPGSSPGSQGRCKAVAGVIQGSGWCRIWAPNTGFSQS